ncbi:hypothetical protein CFS9_39210 [Flavobacterium sp. CFS9]|uniref:GLPGLI family protein n=1 Tax=Flavobacterium sp. CFS9 TaxID=3143118 RepID=A0AAT9H745_9FLAO
MRFNKLYLAILFFCINAFSQEQKINCQKIKGDYQYFQITIFIDSLEPSYINVIGNEINFDSLSKESLSKFMYDLYTKNNFVPSFITDRNFYFKECNPTDIDKTSDLKFTSKFNGEVENLCKKNKKYYDLKTGEKILVKGVRIKGTFLQFDKLGFNFQKISFYPNDLYECSKIGNYIIPLEIEKFCKIKIYNKTKS